MMDLEELLSRLNPMAEEFVSPSLSGQGNGCGDGGFYANGFGVSNQVRNGRMRKKNGYGDGKQRRIDSRTSLAQRDEVIRRTVYVSDIDHRVTEEQLTTLFINCRQVVDCRMHGDPKSVLCFAFIEFTDEEGARAALNLSGTVLGFYPVIVLPSRTAIAPVNPTFLPRVREPLKYEPNMYIFDELHLVLPWILVNTQLSERFCDLSLMMNARCVQGLSTVQILTRRLMIVFIVQFNHFYFRTNCLFLHTWVITSFV
ncbi:unnamed protein product [Musa textilis]